jgi:hypothetical protein
MLRLAKDTAVREGVQNATWILGADTDLPALGELMGPRSLGMAVIGQTLHWMQHEELFRALSPLFRSGGGVAVVSNGTPCDCRTAVGHARCGPASNAISA